MVYSNWLLYTIIYIKWIYYMFENVDEFLFCRPYVSIWALVVNIIIQSDVTIKSKWLCCSEILWGPKSEIQYSILLRDTYTSRYFMIWTIWGAHILHYNVCWFGNFWDIVPYFNLAYLMMMQAISKVWHIFWIIVR